MKAFPISDMTLRDYFAAKALPSVIESWSDWHKSEEAKDEGYEPDWSSDENTISCIAIDAYVMADAMLAERSK